MPTKPLPPASPTGAAAISFEDLIGPVKKALKRLYTLKRTRAKDGNYDGYGNHGHIMATSPDPDEQLDAEGLAYDRERGRKPIDVILRVAFQLGYSQCSAINEATNGREIERYQDWLESKNEHIKLLQEKLETAEKENRRYKRLIANHTRV